MNRRPDTRLNFIYNLLYQLLLLFTPLVTTPCLSRILGAEQMGIFSYSYSAAYYFVLLAMLGLNNYGQREIARVQDDRSARSQTFWSIYFLQMLTGSAAVICYILYCFFFNRDQPVSWIMIPYVLTGILDITWFFLGMEEFKITVLRSSAVKVMSVAAILLFVRSSGDLLLYAVIMAGSQLLSQLILWPTLRKRVRWDKPASRLVLSHLRPDVILFLPVVAVSLYKVMDKIMLGAMTTYAEVGFYEYSEKVLQIPVSCVTALGTAMLPRMSNMAAKKDFRKEYPLILNSMIFGIALAACAAFGLMAVADVFVPFFYGNGYEKCIILFYLLLPSCIFLAIGNVLRTQYLIPHAMDREYTVSLVLGAVVNLCVNRLLIPRLASAGAAVGTLLAEGTVAAAQMYFLKSVLPVGRYLRETAYITACASVMLIVVYRIPASDLPVLTLALKTLAGAFVFVPLMLLRYRALIISVLPVMKNKNKGDNIP